MFNNILKNYVTLIMSHKHVKHGFFQQNWKSLVNNLQQQLQSRDDIVTNIHVSSQLSAVILCSVKSSEVISVIYPVILNIGKFK